MSGTDAGQVDLTNGMQQRQVSNQALELLLLVRAKFLLLLTLSIAVRGGVVVGAPFRLSTAPTTAALVLPWLLPRLLPRLRVVLRPLRLLLGAVTLEMPVRLAPMALVGRGRRHRGSPARNHGPRLVARLLVDVEAVGRLLETVDGCKFIAVVHVANKFEFRGRCQAGQHDVEEDIV